ncbi:PQQ-binding-like beta-propeller repeat protein [Streptomyces sp. NPDC047928]|uniref:outer membrane protein assembly factor BamB family protein n=1 Tax=unclassified Streptomyces TaxID=2593676 RepID=UPI003721C6AA
MPVQPLRDDDPRTVGPYAVLARLHEAASAVRYLAREPGGAPALVTVPPARLAELPAFRRRFTAETRTAELLAGGWVPEPLGSAPGSGTTGAAGAGDGGDGDARGPADGGPRLWTASAYVPALSLGESVALAGPLPERAVRVIGAGLAETLSRVHATGAVLQGLSPDTVLLAVDGPRPAAFGPLGAAVSVEARPGGQVAVRLGYLTPEQVAGAEPRPPSDVFVLGLLLAYAATGAAALGDAADIASAEPDLGSVPDAVRPLIARCLAKAPEDRPTAGEVAAGLALEGAAALARGGWLPAPLATALAAEAATAAGLVRGTVRLAIPTPRTGTAPPSQAPDTGPAPDHGPLARPHPAHPGVALHMAYPETVPAGPAPQSRPAGPAEPAEPAEPAGPPPAVAPVTPVTPVTAGAGLPAPRLSRRGLFGAVAAGAVGAVLGGGGVLAVRGGAEEPRVDPRPAARPRPAVAGVPPQPRWAYESPTTAGGAPRAALWRDRALVLTTDAHAAAVDLATGRRLWQRREGASLAAAMPAGDDLLFVAGVADLLWLAPEDGTVRHRVPLRDRFPGTPGLTVSAIAGQSGSTVWFTGSHTATASPGAGASGASGTSGTAAKPASRTYLFAFDVVRRTPLWRALVPNGRAPHTPRYTVAAVLPGTVVVRQDPLSITPAQSAAAKGLAVFHAYHKASGKLLWSGPLGAARPTAAVAGDDRGRLFAPVGNELHAFDLRTRKPLWRLSGAGAVFGPGAPHAGTLYVANRDQTVYAVDPATGRARWRRSTEATAPGRGVPRVTAGGARGRALLVADGAQVTAFAAADGRRLWKFQDAGVQDPRAGDPVAGYAALVVGTTAVVRRDRMFYALPLSG